MHLLPNPDTGCKLLSLISTTSTAMKHPHHVLTTTIQYKKVPHPSLEKIFPMNTNQTASTFPTKCISHFVCPDLRSPPARSHPSPDIAIVSTFYTQKKILNKNDLLQVWGIIQIYQRDNLF